MRALLVVALTAMSVPSAARAEPVALHCRDAMEASYMRSPCWMHTGHHTYDLGGLHRLGHISGSAFTVEIRFSPPTEPSLVLEASLDGLGWQTLAPVAFDLRRDRQAVTFESDGGGVSARFLRIRQPRSAAQGLSGYLDHSELTADLEPAAGPARPAPLDLRCEDHIMERFFAEHPCWMGGVNRYDSPSVFHTYPLGRTVPLERIAGEATFLPWRTDDYFLSGSRTSIAGVVQTSTDGTDWTDAGTIAGTYGVPIPFDVDADRVGAAYVRLVAERHGGYDTDPALKHVRGMLLGSRLELREQP